MNRKLAFFKVEFRLSSDFDSNDFRKFVKFFEMLETGEEKDSLTKKLDNMSIKDNSLQLINHKALSESKSLSLMI